MNSKLLLAVAFFIIMVELLVITFIVDATKNKIIDSLITEKFKTEKTLASQISHSLKQDLAGVEDLLSLAALSSEIQTENAQVCQKKLSQIFPVIERKIANLVRINEQGIIYCAINRASIGINVLTNKDLANLIQKPSNKAVLHRVIFSPISKKHVAGMHVPVFTEKGEFKGSIGGVIYFEELEKKYFKDFNLLERGHLILIDDNGDVLYHQKKPEMVGKNLLAKDLLNQVSNKNDYQNKIERVLENTKNNTPSFIRYSYPPNPEMIAAYYPVEIFPDRHWAVVVTVPVEDIVNQVDENSLIAGFKNFSTLSIAMIVVVMVTQISLFVYLIAHMSKHVQRLTNKKL